MPLRRRIHQNRYKDGSIDRYLIIPVDLIHFFDLDRDAPIYYEKRLNGVWICSKKTTLAAFETRFRKISNGRVGLSLNKFFKDNTFTHFEMTYSWGGILIQFITLEEEA